VATTSEAIGALIRAGRIRKGWKQADLAEHAGVSRTTLIHLERGAVQDPHATTLNKLAQALDLPAEDLVLSRVGCAHHPTDPHTPQLVGTAHPTGFDVATNPALRDAAERDPERFRGFTAADWQELASHFGVGGGLTVDGALAAADRLQADKSTLHKLRIVLQTHLREPAQQLIDALYQSVEVTPEEVGRRKAEGGSRMPDVADG
jgi:transcriptional regulator with XRE-family HTH domain